jgi:regulator of protease activity HflC (stomatin/prohibitin superfamily)
MIVEIHKKLRTDIREKLLRPQVMLIVKNEATIISAIDAFSGDGLVKLQMDVMKDLINPNGELRKRGVIVENFTIQHIDLDEKYIGEIRARQVATQQKLRADEETKAAQATALKAQAEAKADYNRRVVEAERDKQVGILKAEENAQKQILAAKAGAEQITLAAEADKKKTVLTAEGEKEAGLLSAQAIEALGKARAEAKKLELSAYAVPGADAFVKIEVAKQIASAYGNIRGFLPSDMKVNLLTTSFIESVEKLMGAPKVPAAK